MKATAITRSCAEIAADVCKALKQQPMNMTQLNEAIGVLPRKCVAQKYVQAYRDKGLVYIVRWNSVSQPVYGWTEVPMEDAPKPVRYEDRRLEQQRQYEATWRRHKRSAEAVSDSCAIAFPEPAALVDQLSPRERQVFMAYAKGRQIKQVARDVGISINNVKDRLMSARMKLGVRNRAEAVYLVASARQQ